MDFWVNNTWGQYYLGTNNRCPQTTLIETFSKKTHNKTIKNQRQRKNLKKQQERKKLVSYKGISIMPSVDFSAETLEISQERVEWYIQSIERETFQPTIPSYLAKLSVRKDQRPKEFIITRLILQEKLKGVLQAERKGH